MINWSMSADARNPDRGIRMSGYTEREMSALKMSAWKRKAAFLLAVILLGVLCAGCGGKNQPVGTPEPIITPGASAASSPTGSPEPTGEPEPTESPEPTAPPEPTTYLVASVEELFDVIRPGVEITLQAGIYDLSQWAETATKEGYESDYVQAKGVPAGYQVIISGVDGLTLSGKAGGYTELVTEYAYADVLRFENCSDITLKNMTMGHAVEPGFCAGDVLEFNDCKNVSLSGMDLYGCGTYGIAAQNCTDLTATDSVIRDCSYGILNALDSKGLRLENCVLKNCEGYSMLDSYNTDMTFVSCSFTGNKGGSLTSTDENASFRFEHCSFGRWESGQAASLSDSANVSFDKDCAYWDTESGHTESGNVVTVSTAEEFVMALDSNLTVVMEPGVYNLSKWMNAVWEAEGDLEYYNNFRDSPLIGYVYDGFEVVFCHLNNLTIRSSTGDREDVLIVVEPRYATVMNFDDCTDLELKNVTIGHTDGSTCSGGVLDFANCRDVFLTNVDLYGCGVNGIEFEYSKNLFVYDSLIRDCSDSAFYICDYEGQISFVDSQLTGSGGAFLSNPASDDAVVSFSGCSFGEWESNILYFRDDIEFTDCTWSEITSYPDYPDYSDDDEYGDLYYRYPYTNWKPFGMDFELVPFDEYVLQDTIWDAVAGADHEAGFLIDFTDPESIRNYWNPSGTGVRLSFHTDKSGVLTGYTEEAEAFSWACDSAYSAVLSLESGAEFSLSLYADYVDESETEADLYLLLSIEGLSLWFQ